ncbi:hypothetical protein HU200_040395 [Digitaria exilis]|uniref:Uncharacterized protein n=1 Tax=Digitaria exilis TaxID=1010633 RepID=A0A835EIN4_9POAL|nr:hypothetical protein HU200_040395 [Digitaria exilis]
MQTICRRAYWLRFWSLLQSEDTDCSMASKALEVHIFVKNEW